MIKKILIYLLSASFCFGLISSDTDPQFKIVVNSDEKSYRHFDITHYDLTIDLYPEENHLEGLAAISFFPLKNFDGSFELDFSSSMKIRDVKINGKDISYEHKDDLIKASFQPDEDTSIIQISYSGTPEKEGFAGFVFGKINGQSLVYNLSEPDYASTWFPCNDIPSDKALLDIKISNTKENTSVSNGILISETETGERKTYHWKTIYPISTYLVAVYSSNYITFSDSYISMDAKDTMSIDYYVIPEHFSGAQKDFSEHPNTLRVLSGLFGEYPFIKEKYGVAEFLWQYGAMEHQTITGIGSNFVQGNNFFEDIYVHELAHHWWGNAIGPKSWKDIWLNEGFSTYSEALYAESEFGKKALISKMLSKYRQRYSGTLYEPASIFNSTVYDKGAWVLHMLRGHVGDSVFFKILHSYLDKYKYKSASTSDFKRICESVSGMDMTKFFDQWIYTGEDQIKVKVDFIFEKNGNGYEVKLNLKQIQDDYDEFHFYVDVQIEGDNGITSERIFVDKVEQNFKIFVKFKPEKIIMDPAEWLLAHFIIND